MWPRRQQTYRTYIQIQPRGPCRTITDDCGGRGNGSAWFCKFLITEAGSVARSGQRHRLREVRAGTRLACAAGGVTRQASRPNSLTAIA